MDLDTILDRTIVLGYTKVGYRARARGFEPLPRIDGQTVVVTGATGGIGRAAATQLAGLGARVVAVGRSEQKLAGLVDDLGPDAAYEVADLSLMAEVRDLGRRLAARGSIDVLVNNVGALFPERSETSEGLERTFALNLLGQYLLTTDLRDALRGGGRVIMVSSGGMYSERIHPDDLESRREEYRGTRAYARTKRGQVILAEEWAKAWRDDGITANSMHPGWVETPGVDASLPTFSKVVGPLLRTPDEGADTITFLAAAPDPGTGLFWHDRKPRPTHVRSGTRETPEQRAEFLQRLEEYAERF